MQGCTFQIEVETPLDRELRMILNTDHNVWATKFID